MNRKGKKQTWGKRKRAKRASGCNSDERKTGRAERERERVRRERGEGEKERINYLLKVT